MQKGTGTIKLAVPKLSVILAVDEMSVAAGELVTHSLVADVLAVEVYTAISKLTMSILLKFTSIGFHVHKRG